MKKRSAKDMSSDDHKFIRQNKISMKNITVNVQLITRRSNDIEIFELISGDVFIFFCLDIHKQNRILFFFLSTFYYL